MTVAVVAVDFEHFDRSFKAGDQLDDSDPLVAAAPYLFGNAPPPDPQPKPRKR